MLRNFYPQEILNFIVAGGYKIVNAFYKRRYKFQTHEIIDLKMSLDTLAVLLSLHRESYFVGNNGC